MERMVLNNLICQAVMEVLVLTVMTTMMQNYCHLVSAVAVVPDSCCYYCSRH